MTNSDPTVPIFYLINATSLAKPHAVSLLGTDLHHHQAFAGFVTETWFNSKNTDDTVAIAGYTLIRRDRLKRKGGGVCVYIRHLLDAMQLLFY